MTNVGTSVVLCVKVMQRLRDSGVEFESGDGGDGGGVKPATIEQQIKLFNPIEGSRDKEKAKAKAKLLHDSKTRPRPEQAN